MNAAVIFDFLKANNIDYERVDHPAVYTCEEASRMVPDTAGVATKNLFLRDGKGKRHFLVTVAPEKSVNLKGLSKVLSVSGLGFASPERLRTYLGLEPGSVTLLAVVNDTRNAVEVVIDRSLWQSEVFCCHPLVNTSTLALSKASLSRILELTGHSPQIVEVPNAEVPIA